MRRRFSLGQQIALVAATLVFFVVVASGLGIWYASFSAGALHATQQGVAQIGALTDLESAWNNVSATVDRMLVTRQSSLADDDLVKDLALFNSALATVSEQSFGNRVETVATNRQIAADLQFFGDELNVVVSSIQMAARQRQWAQAQVLRHTELSSLQRRFEVDLQALRQNTRGDIDALVAQSTQRQRSTRASIIAGLIAAVALGVAFTVGGVRQIITPINMLIERARRIREGDFSYVPPLDRDDEIGALSASFTVMAEWLTDSYQVLEERVEERTQDLRLAAEVGRRLARVRDLDALLQEAVELIRRRFDLYYTQVYLTSADERSLELRAGTGEVGEELRRRGFKLPIGHGSVNGSAAQERQPMIIPDTEQSGRFRPNALLPDTRSEIAMPLLAGNRVVGVLDLQSDRRYGLTEESLAAFEVLAGQLAIAIENASLFSEIQRARAAFESQAVGHVKENWRTFLNAVDRPERLVYTYVGGTVRANPQLRLTETASDHSLNTVIELNNVRLGQIRLKAQPQQRWTAQDLETVQQVARLVAQQAENLRLLADAERYREEAETTLRRLTHDNWQELSSRIGAYQYDGREVVALEDGDAAHDLAQPLLVRGEAVGELLVDPHETLAEDEAKALVTAVASRLSTHLEQLRLSQQTEMALADVRRRSEELANLNRIVTRIAGTLDLRHSLQIVVEELVALTAADQARIGLLNEDRSALTIVSEAFDESRSPSALGLSIPVEGNALTQEVLATAGPMIIHDAQTHPLTAPIRAMLAEQGIQTMIILPILSGNEIIGTVGADILSAGVDFGNDDLRLAETVVFQAATAIENARLFDQVQATLAETRALYRAGAELNRARSYDDLLDVLRQHTVAGDDSTTLSLALFDSPWTESRKPQWIDILAYWAPTSAEEPKLRFRLQDYPALEILEQNRHAIIEDVRGDPRLDERSRRALLHGFRARAVLAVPLVAGGQWIGHVNALYPEPRGFSEGELQQLQNLVGQAAIAVQRINLLQETSRLLESEQRQRRISDTLVRASRQINVAMTYGEILDTLREHTMLGVNALGASLNYFDRPWAEDQPPAWIVVLARRSETSGELPDSRFQLRDATGLAQVLEPDTVAVVEDIAHNPRLDNETRSLLWGETGATCALVAPLRVGGQLRGFVAAYYPQTVEVSDLEAQRLMALASQAAVAAQGLELLRQAERRAQRERILREVTARVRSATDVDVIMKTAVREVSRALGRDAFVTLGAQGSGDGGNSAPGESEREQMD